MTRWAVESRLLSNEILHFPSCSFSYNLDNDKMQLSYLDKELEEKTKRALPFAE